jgi:hypothetical protein
MPSTTWTTAILIQLYGSMGIAKSWAHAFALLVGLIFWHYIFPHAPAASDAGRLPSKARYLQQLEIDVETPAHRADTECPACWHEFDDPVRLECGHRFCEDCIRPWLDGNNSCPVCRRALYNPDRPSNGEQINLLAHKLRVCTAVMNIMITLLKTLPCFWILRGWQTSLVPLFQCTMGGTSLLDCFDGLTYIVLSILMMVSAKQAITTHGTEWHRTQLSGTWNIIATIGWLRHCDTELRTLAAISSLALRRKS